MAPSSCSLARCADARACDSFSELRTGDVALLDERDDTAARIAPADRPTRPKVSLVIPASYTPVGVAELRVGSHHNYITITSPSALHQLLESHDGALQRPKGEGWTRMSRREHAPLPVRECVVMGALGDRTAPTRAAAATCALKSFTLLACSRSFNTSSDCAPDVSHPPPPTSPTSRGELQPEATGRLLNWTARTEERR
jgi:hypothetical protein